MERQAFLETMVFLDGAYARSFPQAFRDVAWGMFQGFDGRLVQQSAVRMVEAGEEYPSPMKWRQYLEAIVHEEFDARMHQLAMAKMEERAERLLRDVEAGPRSIARPRRPDESDDERIAYLKTLIGTEEEDGTARADDCREYIRLMLAKPYPAGHMLA